MPMTFTRAVLLRGRVMPWYVVRLSVRLSVCLSGVTLMYTDDISLATSNFITRLISPVSQLFASITSAI